ncbi:hypothetical protein Hdeb2414_s0005g00162441 [Helianthus debilis subsp. tardiflorus]
MVLKKCWDCFMWCVSVFCSMFCVVVAAWFVFFVFLFVRCVFIVSCRVEEVCPISVWQHLQISGYPEK